MNKRTLTAFIFEEILVLFAGISVLTSMGSLAFQQSLYSNGRTHPGLYFFMMGMALLCFFGAGIIAALSFGKHYFDKSFLYYAAWYLLLMCIGFNFTTFATYEELLLSGEALAWLAFIGELIPFFFVPLILLLSIIGDHDPTREPRIVAFSFVIALGVGVLAILTLRVGLWALGGSIDGRNPLEVSNLFIFSVVLAGILTGCFMESAVLDEIRTQGEETLALPPTEKESRD